MHILHILSTLSKQCILFYLSAKNAYFVFIINIFLWTFLIFKKFGSTNRFVPYCNQLFQHTTYRKIILVNFFWRYSFFSSMNQKYIKSTSIIFKRKFKKNIICTYYLLKKKVFFLFLCYFFRIFKIFVGIFVCMFCLFLLLWHPNPSHYICEQELQYTS